MVSTCIFIYLSYNILINIFRSFHAKNRDLICRQKVGNMREELLDRLKKITPEEEQYLGGRDQVHTEFYTEAMGGQLIVDSS